MIPELREIDFEFLRIVLKGEKNLSQIRYKIDLRFWGTSLSTTQKILTKLEKIGFVRSERRGRRRFVVLTKDGKYFYDWYGRKKRRK